MPALKGLKHQRSPQRVPSAYASEKARHSWQQASFLACTLLCTVLWLRAAVADDFYAGKTITLSSYDLPGAGYSVYMQLLAHHFGKYIPGHPMFITTNQPGAGGLLAINHAALMAPQDGTFLSMVSQGLLIFEATGQSGLQKSLRDFHWIGSFTQSNNVTVTWAASGIKTLQDARERQVITGATGVGSASVIGPLIYNAVLGTKFKPVYGYEGSGAIMLAMRRGELDSPGNTVWATLKEQQPDDLKNGLLNILIQTGLRKEPDLPDTPFFLDLVKGDPEKEQIAHFMSYAVSIARPLAAPPGVPPERVEILRRAFDQTMRDPDFLAEAASQNLDIDPLSGARVEQIVTDVLNTPKAVEKSISVVLGVTNK